MDKNFLAEWKAAKDAYWAARAILEGLCSQRWISRHEADAIDAGDMDKLQRLTLARKMEQLGDIACDGCSFVILEGKVSDLPDVQFAYKVFGNGEGHFRVVRPDIDGVYPDIEPEWATLVKSKDWYGYEDQKPQ